MLEFYLKIVQFSVFLSPILSHTCYKFKYPDDHMGFIAFIDTLREWLLEKQKKPCDHIGSSNTDSAKIQFEFFFIVTFRGINSKQKKLKLYLSCILRAI